jgi:hypothetical protein
MDEIFDERFFVVWGCGEMKKEEKKKRRDGGEEGVFIPQGSGVALAWGVLQVIPHFSTSPLQLPAL